MGDVEGVVVSTVMRPFEVTAGELARSTQPDRASPSTQRDERLHVDVVVTERIGDTGAIALGTERATVVLTIAGPYSAPRPMRLDELSARISEGHSSIDLLLREGRQLGAEVRDCRDLGPHENRLLLAYGKRPEVEGRQADLDDLADHPVRWRPAPTGCLQVDDEEGRIVSRSAHSRFPSVVTAPAQPWSSAHWTSSLRPTSISRMSIDLNQPWTSARFASFDLETTGTDTDTDRIIEVGIVVFENGEVVERYQQLVDPERELPDVIVDVTGIKPADLEGQPVFAEVVDKVMDLLRGTLLVAYNHEFDTAVLTSELARVGRSEELPPCMDPFPFVYEHFREPGLTRNAKLTTISQHLGIPLGAAHRADHDAEATGRVLLELPNHVVLPDTVAELLQVQRALLRAVTEKFNRFRRNRGGDGRALNSSEILIELGAAYLYGDEADPVRALFSRIPDVRDLA